MPDSESGLSRAGIWQGFRHAWEYNHRLNRFGSYVLNLKGPDGAARTVAGHTSASGTGNDTAHFSEFVTQVDATDGLAFQSGHVETIAECQRGDLTPFVARVEDLDLAPNLQGRDVYTVVINGFDIYADEHSEKIMTFDVEVTNPTVDADGTKLRFHVLGNLRFDCRSPECQLLPLRLETERLNRIDTDGDGIPDAPPPLVSTARPKRGIDRHRVDRIARWLKRQLQQLTDVEEVKRSIIGEDGDTLRRRLFRLFGREFYFRFLKWRLSAPYVLRVHYLIIAADRDALTVTDGPFVENRYEWDLEHEIHREDVGKMETTLSGDNPARYDANVLAFKRLFLDVHIDEEMGSDDPIQWGQGMHLLEWDLAIHRTEIRDSVVIADLDLFYKNWSDAMNQVITFTTWGAVRAAGRARIGARLALLQMRGTGPAREAQIPATLYWPGRGLSSRNDPRAIREQNIAGASDGIK